MSVDFKDLRWSRYHCWDRCELLHGLIVIFRRNSVQPLNDDDMRTETNNYRIIGMWPDRWDNLDPLSAQAILFHLKEKYDAKCAE